MIKRNLWLIVGGLLFFFGFTLTFLVEPIIKEFNKPVKQVEKPVKKKVVEKKKKKKRYFYGLYKIPPKKIVNKTADGYKMGCYRNEKYYFNVVQGDYKKLISMPNNLPSWRFKRKNINNNCFGLEKEDDIIKFKNIGKETIWVEVEVKKIRR